jgi:hypothetical protein
MRSTRQKLGILLILGAIAVPLTVVSAAYACGVLATLYLSPSQVHSGATVAGHGNNYFSPTPVTLHFNSRSGPVVWSGTPSKNGMITPSFRIPNVKSGYYLIMAEQSTPKGIPAVGTPGRAVIHVGASHSRRGASALWVPSGGRHAGPTATAESPSASVSSRTVLMATLLSGLLLGSGMTLLGGDRRRRRHAAHPAS